MASCLYFAFFSSEKLFPHKIFTSLRFVSFLFPWVGGGIRRTKYHKKNINILLQYIRISLFLLKYLHSFPCRNFYFQQTLPPTLYTRSNVKMCWFREVSFDRCNLKLKCFTLHQWLNFHVHLNLIKRIARDSKSLNRNVTIYYVHKGNGKLHLKCSRGLCSLSPRTSPLVLNRLQLFAF